MPQKFESTILDLDEIPEGECKHLPLNCLWTITSKDEPDSYNLFEMDL